jgi:hypothetical protein
VFDRNPRYWRKSADGTQLPYLDRIVLAIVPSRTRSCCSFSRAPRISPTAICGLKTTCRSGVARKRAS